MEQKQWIKEGKAFGYELVECQRCAGPALELRGNVHECLDPECGFIATRDDPDQEWVEDVLPEEEE